MKSIFHITVLLLFCSWLNSQESELKTQIEQIIKYDTQIEFDKTPGILVSVIDGDSTWHISLGSTEPNVEKNISSNDIFEVGSVTKVFTSSIIDVLEYKGLLSKEDKVNTFLEEEFTNPRLAHLSIKDLLNHNSQLPKRPHYFGKYEGDSKSPYKYYKRDYLLKFYKEFIPDQEEFFVYSHVNYALLEIIIERVTGLNFGDVLDKYIFLPLDMARSFIDFKEQKNDVISKGYDRSLNECKPWEFSSFKGSEALKTCGGDLVKFLRANMGFSNSPLDSVLFDNFDEMNISFNDRLYISNGWHLLEVGGKKIITHTGRTSGHSAFMAFMRETKTGVIVLSNSAYGSQDLGMLVLRMLNFNWKRDS